MIIRIRIKLKICVWSNCSTVEFSMLKQLDPPFFNLIYTNNKNVNVLVCSFYYYQWNRRDGFSYFINDASHNIILYGDCMEPNFVLTRFIFHFIPRFSSQEGWSVTMYSHVRSLIHSSPRWVSKLPLTHHIHILTFLLTNSPM